MCRSLNANILSGFRGSPVTYRPSRHRDTGRTVRSNEGNVLVAVCLTPTLRQGHYPRLVLDGTLVVLQEATLGSTFTGIFPGPGHQLYPERSIQGLMVPDDRVKGLGRCHCVESFSHLCFP